MEDLKKVGWGPYPTSENALCWWGNANNQTKNRRLL